MKIEELKENSKVTNLIGKITKIDEPVDTPAGPQCQDAILEDDTGQTQITFWGEQIDAYKAGDKIELANGWCKKFKESLKVSSGKFGKIKRVEE